MIYFLLHLQGTSLTKVSARGSMHCWKDIVSSMVRLFLKLSKALVKIKKIFEEFFSIKYNPWSCSINAGILGLIFKRNMLGKLFQLRSPT